MKACLSYSFLSLAIVLIVSIAVPVYAETTPAKETPAAKTPIVPAADAATKVVAPGAVEQPPVVQPLATQPSLGKPLAVQPQAAQPAVTPPDTAAVARAPVEQDDPLKDITIYKQPDSFAAAQQLAVQYREENIAQLQKSILCVQQATTMDDLTACQKDERREFDKIRLSYCDTMVGSYGTNKNMPKANKGQGKGKGKGKDKNKSVDTAAESTDAMPPRQKKTECDKALAAVTGKRMPRGNTNSQPDGVEPQ